MFPGSCFVTAALRYLAISIILLYAWYVASDSLLHVNLSSAVISMRVNLVRPLTWLIVGLSLLTAWGVGRRYRWAWYLGLIGSLAQLARVVWWVLGHHSLTHPPGIGLWLVAGMLVAVVVLLLTPQVRHSCTR